MVMFCSPLAETAGAADAAEVAGCGAAVTCCGAGANCEGVLAPVFCAPVLCEIVMPDGGCDWDGGGALKKNPQPKITISARPAAMTARVWSDISFNFTCSPRGRPRANGRLRHPVPAPDR